MPAKSKPQIKAFTPPAERAHWFEVWMAINGDAELPFNLDPLYTCDENNSQLRMEIVLGKNEPKMALPIYKAITLALSARDAHYQLSIQMEALGWTEGQNWRVTMICPKAEK